MNQVALPDLPVEDEEAAAPPPRPPGTFAISPVPGMAAVTKRGGEVVLMHNDDAYTATQRGEVRPSTQVEYFGARTGTAGTIAAGAAGFSRVATFGLSDKAYVEAARLAGDDNDAEDMAATLRLAKQANPNATLGGELAGIVPGLFYGAGEAEGAAALGEGAVARFGARALAAAPRAIGEGAAIGAGAQLSEDTLENHKFSGEAYASSIAKGGLLGLFLGVGGAGALGAAGDKLGSLVGRGERGALQAEEAAVRAEGGPYRAGRSTETAGAETGGRKSLLGHVEDLRDQATYGATGATRKDLANLGATEAEQSSNRARIADMLRTETTAEGRPLVSAGATEKEVGQRVLAKKQEIGAALGPLYKEADAAAARPSMDAISEGLAELRAKHAGSYAEEEMRGAETAFAKLAKQENLTHYGLWEEAKKIGSLKTNPIESAALQEFQGVVRGELAKSVDRASAELGGTIGDRLRLNNQLYADLKTVSDVTERAAKRGDGGLFSLKDAVLASSAVTAALAGHPVGLAAVGLNIVRRKFGNQIASHVLDTAVRMESVQRALSKMDDLIDSGAKAFVSGSKGVTRAVKPVTTEEVRAIREATRSPEAVTARVSDALGDMPKTAPKLAQEVAATASRAAAWLQHSLPKESPPLAPFGKPKDVPLSDTDLLKSRAIMETVADGSIVIDRMRQGNLTDEHVATLKYVHPETYVQIQKYLTQHATDLNKTMTQQQLFRLGMLFGEPLTEAALPENVRAFQASFTQGNQAPGKGGSGGNTGLTAIGTKSATQTQKLEAGSS